MARTPVIHIAAEALKPQPPIEWLIEPLFSIGGVSLIVGEGGSKKTYALVDAAVCVASGEPWLGMRSTRASTLIIDEESGERRLSRRIGDVMRGHQAASDIPLQYTCLERFSLKDMKDGARVYSLITQTKAQFIIIDALADVMLGADENSVKDVQPVFAVLRWIADSAKCSIVVIHHANKNGIYRGSTALKGAVDLMLMTESKPDSPNIYFNVEKARDIDPFSFSATVHFEPDHVWLEASAAVQARRLSPAQHYVLDYLTHNGRSMLKDIAANADRCSAAGARKAVYDLVRMNYIERVDHANGRGSLAEYDLINDSAVKSVIDQLNNIMS